jgi:hypothetical protein
MALPPFLGGVTGAGIALAIWGHRKRHARCALLHAHPADHPRHLLGRLMGVIYLATLGVYPLSVGLVGIGVARLGPVTVLPLGGAIMFVSLIVGLTQREIRQAA